MTLLRRVLFYLFVLIYLCTCPLIILRMLGFVRDPNTHFWVKTGIIYISSNPPDAKVFLNNRLTPETTPTVIRDLLPGTYTIRMELPGYESWQNSIPVVDKKATSVENVLLIPEQWNIKPLSNIPLSKLIPVAGTNYLLVSSEDTVKGLYVLKLDKDDDKPQPLFPEESIYRDAQVVRFYTVDKSPFLILAINIDERHKYLWIDPKEEQIHIEDISDLIPENPRKLTWEPNDDRNIYAFYDSGVSRIKIKEKAIYPNILDKDIPQPKKSEAMPDHLPKADQLFLINNSNTILFRQDRHVFLMDLITFGKPRLTKVVKVNNDTEIYFAEKTGRLYFISPGTRLLTQVQIMHHRPFIPKPIAETLRLQKLDE